MWWHQGRGHALGRTFCAGRRTSVDGLAPDAQRQALTRFLLYSHDGLGLGHVRRNLAVAAAITELAPDAAVLLATGVDLGYGLRLPDGLDTLKLPALRKVTNGSYEARSLPITARQVVDLRSALLTTAVESFDPDVLLVDKHPLGVAGELRGALGALRRSGGVAVLGLRDILDEAEVVRREWRAHETTRVITEHYDRVFVYGRRTVFDPVREYDLPESVEHRTTFCGYVTSSSASRPGRAGDPQGLAEESDRQLVLATAGGGEDGFALLSTFIDTAAGAPWRGIVVAGPGGTSAERSSLQARADQAGVDFHSYVPDLSRWFRSVHALVCMGGYNSLTEATSTGTPTVCVPRVRPRTEQRIRAQAFARLGLLRTLDPDQLDPVALGREVTAAMRTPRAELEARANALVGFGGAHRSAEELVTLARRRPAARAAARSA